MANVQIYQLDNVGSDLDSGALLACDVEINGDEVTRKVSVSALENQMLNVEEYSTELETESQTIFGAINEQHGVIGASAWDDATSYAVGDVCVHNNTLWVCKTAHTNQEPASGSTYWIATTLQPKTDNTLATTDKTVVGAINELNSGLSSIGTRVNGSKTATVFTRSWAQKGSIVLNKGTWIIFCYVLLQQDANGYRAMNVATTSGDSTPQSINMAISGELTALRLETCVTVSSDNSSYYWNGIHNSTQNSELSIESWALFAIRIA